MGFATTGTLLVLTKAGYEVTHRHNPKRHEMQGQIQTVVTGGELKEPLVLEQSLDHRGATSLEEIYWVACVKLGLLTPHEHIPEGPVELVVERKPGLGSGNEDIVFRHPSFGVVVLTKYSSNGPKQFMSPVNTRGGMQIEIYSTELAHDLHHGSDRTFPGKLLCSINMSFTQFAEFVTSVGEGAGIPCTIQSLNGRYIDPCDLPSAEQRLEESSREDMERAVGEVQRLLKEMEPIFNSPGGIGAKEKKELWKKLWYPLRDLSEKPSTVLRRFTEHMDKAIVHAKSEFENYVRFKRERALSRKDEEQVWNEIVGEVAPALNSGVSKVNSD